MVFIRLLIKKKTERKSGEKKLICFTIFIPSQTRICPHAFRFTPEKGLLLGKRLDMLLLRHRIRKYPVDSSSTPCGFTFSLESGLKNMRIRLRVDGSHIRKKILRIKNN